MTRELMHQLERLGQERQRLESLLSRQPAWVELGELLQHVEGSDDQSRHALARRRAELEEELEGDPIHAAHRSVMAAIQVIEGLMPADPAVSTGSPGMPALETASPLPVSEADSAPACGEGAADTAVPAVLGDRHVGRVVTSAATIHHGPPGPQAMGPATNPADLPADPLTRIRRIDKGLAAALIARGVRHFAQIAAFGPADVRALSAALGLGRRISQENWIEQAALLAMKAGADASVGMPKHKVVPDGIAAGHSRLLAASGLAAAADVQHLSAGFVTPALEDAAQLLAPANSEPQSVSVPPTSLAAGPEYDVARLVHDIAQRIAGQGSRQSVEAVLAAPAEIALASLSATPTVPEPEPAPAADAVLDAHRSDVAISDDATAANTTPDVATPDDLTLIAGIDEERMSRLADAGVRYFADIAAWDAAAVARFSGLLGPDAQIARDGWIAQAALLARGIMTAHAQRVRAGMLNALVARLAEPAGMDEAFVGWLAAHTQGFRPNAEVGGGREGLNPPAAPLDASERADLHADTSATGDETLDVPQMPEVASDVAVAAEPAPVSVDVAEPVSIVPSSMVAESTPSEVDDATLQLVDTTFEATSEAAAAITIEAPAPVEPPCADAHASASLTGAPADSAPAHTEQCCATAMIPSAAEAHVSADVANDPMVDETAGGTLASEAPLAEPPPTHEPDALKAALPSPSTAPALSIADRITAIERGAADLTRPPRSAFGRLRERWAQAAGRGAEGGAGSVSHPSQLGHHRPPVMPADYGEADVRIVRPTAHESAPHSPSDPTPEPHVVPNCEASGTDEHAAYRGIVEEARVQIVHGLPDDDAAGPGADNGPTDGRNALRTHQELSKVRRFLKALTGE